MSDGSWTADRLLIGHPRAETVLWGIKPRVSARGQPTRSPLHWISVGRYWEGWPCLFSLFLSHRCCLFSPGGRLSISFFYFISHCYRISTLTLIGRAPSILKYSIRSAFIGIQGFWSKCRSYFSTSQIFLTLTIYIKNIINIYDV